MSDTADARALLPAAIDRFTVRVLAVGDDAWDAPTPCAAWPVRDVVAHLCSEHEWAPHVLAGEPLETVGDRYSGDRFRADPVGSWRHAVARSRPCWTATATHADPVPTSFGPLAVAEYAEQMLLDLTVHEWDLARGAGLDEELDVVGVERALAYVRSDPIMLTGPGLFGDPVAPAGAAPRDELLARLGRRV
ncbi:TIGR03086 family metal-binding protein [Actinomycetospora cinnamomea]|uniref:Uncharacterized protein (TIGR03086 family) n=1 Tax=Actinomycetospora cinnamomea TaxID=663609 RepID=A0A2U1EZN8_9PSEU|nr:TIGR03086 family metal-binding protein [Actinomycetospora cinnamomea]PVZ05388.1 uncharacterized protein (TIGR03086 family) [Actinomycetospora cinnamomea]